MKKGCEIKDGFCQCGCGQRTNVARYNDRWKGHKRGQPMKFIRGHNMRVAKRKRDARFIGSGGYIYIAMPNHPRATSKGYVLEHIMIAENALGKLLPPGCVIHHIDGIKSKNQNNNLVVCQDDRYHKLLHVRYRALKACGNPRWRKCTFCKEYDDLNNLLTDKRNVSYHKKCSRKYQRLTSVNSERS